MMTVTTTTLTKTTSRRRRRRTKKNVKTVPNGPKTVHVLSNRFDLAVLATLTLDTRKLAHVPDDSLGDGNGLILTWGVNALRREVILHLAHRHLPDCDKFADMSDEREGLMLPIK